MFGAKPKLCVVALAYYPNYFDSLLQTVKTISQTADITALALVLNNPRLDDVPLESICRNSYSLRHDNSGAEFGGYQAGLDLIKDKISSPFDLIIINDSASVHYPLSNEQIRALVSAMADKRPNRIVGHIDRSDPLWIDDLQTSRWVRSNFVGLDHEALCAIDHEIYQPSLNYYLNDTVDTFFTDHIKESTRRKLSDWLFMASDQSWYGAAPLTEDNCAKMAAKARSILQELYLAMRLEQKRTTFVQPKLNMVGRISLGTKALLGSWRSL